MIRPFLLCAVFLLPATALASSFAGTSAGASSASSSASSGSTSGDDKVLLAARDTMPPPSLPATANCAAPACRRRCASCAQAAAPWPEADDLALARRILAL